MRFLIFLIAGLFPYSLYSQQTIHGQITEPDGQPLAFVTIMFDGEPGKGLLTDIEGRFSFETQRVRQFIRLRHIGFKEQDISLDSLQRLPGDLKTLILLPADYDLPEAVVLAGENPADILIRKAIANRKRNNPERRKSYTCRTYNKVLLDAMPNRVEFEQKLQERDTSKETVKEFIEEFNKVESAMTKHHGFLMESVTKRTFRFPNQIQEQVLLNRVSGFKNAGLVALANLVQPFSFYGDYLTILDKNFVNPISPGSPERYFFHIEDTIPVYPDTIWVISFRPRKNKVFDALSGVLHLHSKGWAIQNVQAAPASTGNLYLKIEQAYSMVETGDQDTSFQWFPSQLNFELGLRKYPSPEIGMRAAGRSYIDEVVVDAPVRQRDFNVEKPVLMLPGAQNRTDSAWGHWRQLAPLSTKEERTYEWLDSVGSTRKFDRLSTFMDVLTTGRLPLAGGPISINLPDILQLNDYEGARLGIGLTNAQARPLSAPRRLELGAKLGYGLRDKALKFGGYARWRVQPGGQTQVLLRWQRDLLEPGTLYEIPPAALVNRRLYAQRMDRMDEWLVQAQSKLGRFFQIQGGLTQQKVNPTYSYQYGSVDNGFSEQFQFTEASFFLRYSNGERSQVFLGNDIGSIQRVPVVEIAYTKGWKGLFGGEYAYERWTAALYHSFFLGRLGRMRWRLEGGWASGDAPLAKLFTLNQTGGNWNIFILPNTFQALPDTMFLANRFVNLYFAQEIGPVFYKHKFSAPYLTLLQNAAWGDLARPDLHHGIGFRVASPTLLESGVQLDNLLRINYLNFAYFGLGAAVFYRWGGLEAEDWKDNILVRATLRMNLQ